jgi:hypothetical protein
MHIANADKSQPNNTKDSEYSRALVFRSMRFL